MNGGTHTHTHAYKIINIIFKKLTRLTRETDIVLRWNITTKFIKNNVSTKKKKPLSLPREVYETDIPTKCYIVFKNEKITLKYKNIAYIFHALYFC